MRNCSPNKPGFVAISPRLNLGLGCATQTSMNNPAFQNGEIYHIYNRGADKRVIFTDNQDFSRFANCLDEFNDINPALHWKYKSEVQPRTRVVEILAFCLMPNHYHLLLRQIKNAGITLFMRKIGTGYTMYFNEKNKRSGTLFQGRYKAKYVDSDSYIRHLAHYIHLNPVGLSASSWQEHGIASPKAKAILDDYRWSSWHAYIGKSIFGNFLNKNFIEEINANSGGYAHTLFEWLKEFDPSELKSVSFD